MTPARPQTATSANLVRPDRPDVADARIQRANSGPNVFRGVRPTPSICLTGETR